MKSYLALAVIALLLTNSLTEAVSVKSKDLGDLDLPTLVDDNDVILDKKIID